MEHQLRVTDIRGDYHVDDLGAGLNHKRELRENGFQRRRLNLNHYNSNVVLNRAGFSDHHNSKLHDSNKYRNRGVDYDRDNVNIHFLERAGDHDRDSDAAAITFGNISTKLATR